MSISIVQPESVPRPALSVRRGLLEPYDLPLTAAIIIAALVSLWSGDNLLQFQSWMLPHIILFSGVALISLVVVMVYRFFACSPSSRVRHRILWKSLFKRHFGATTLLLTLRFIIVMEHDCYGDTGRSRLTVSAPTSPSTVTRVFASSGPCTNMSIWLSP